MNIQHDIQSMLKESGWNATRLAREAGVPQSSLSRLLAGKQGGVHSATIERLWPYLYGELRPEPAEQPVPDEAA